MVSSRRIGPDDHLTLASEPKPPPSNSCHHEIPHNRVVTLEGSRGFHCVTPGGSINYQPTNTVFQICSDSFPSTYTIGRPHTLFQPCTSDSPILVPLAPCLLLPSGHSEILGLVCCPRNGGRPNSHSLVGPWALPCSLNLNKTRAISQKLTWCSRRTTKTRKITCRTRYVLNPIEFSSQADPYASDSGFKTGV